MPTNFLTPEVQEIALSLMTGLDCARSLTVAILIRNREWIQLVNLECTPSAYLDADDYLRAASATDFLRKMSGDIEGIDRDSATLEKWLESERQCFSTNVRLNEIMDFGTLDGMPVPDTIADFISRMRKNLLTLIGSGPDPVFPGSFGPGATISDTAKIGTTVLHKMSSIPTLTTSALFYLVPWIGTKWGMACASRWDVPVTVRGNTYFSVKKTAKVDRPCAKEPSINAFYQAGLGRQLRERLRMRGIDLEHGQMIHRQVACAASKNGEFCTIDLASASDTLSRALVKLVIPRGWYNHLNDLRSPFTKVRDRWYKLEKFSSMGNGFTFELETAIYCALCMASYQGIPGKNLWVYGDDIIVPTDQAQNVISALKFFGFTPNHRKTFIDGPFRESCGGDFYNGTAVRPFSLKELPSEPQHYISLANGIRRMALKNGSSDNLFAFLRPAWFKCLDNIPAAIRQCRGPEDLGDLVICDSEERWRTNWRSSGIRWIRVYRPASFRGVSFARFDSDIQFAGALYGVFLFPSKPKPGWPEGYDARRLHLRDGVLGYKVGWLPYS